MVGAGSPLHADFLKIVLTRFCRLRYKGVPLLEPRELTNAWRNHVATPYSASTQRTEAKLHPMKKKSASQSAFFKLRLLLGVLLCFAGITIVLLGQPRTPSVQSDNSHPIVQTQFRGVMPVVKFDISPPLRDMKPLPWKQCTLREDEDRDISAPSCAPWSGRARPGCATGARQNWNTGTDYHFRWEQQPVRLLAPGPQWSGRSQSRSDDGQPAFSDF